MITGQIGIFALGDTAHGFFEFTVTPGADPAAVVSAVADLRPPHTTLGGVNLIAGFRPELWRAVDPEGVPPEIHGFNQPLSSADGYTIPATQADVFIWYAGSAYDVIFDLGKSTISALRGLATLERELSGWSYHHSRDLTGFEDGSENPNLFEAPEVALIDNGEPGAGGSVLLLQKWRHKLSDFEALSVDEQERVIGRTKAESIELDEEAMPENAHVKRNKFVENGEELPIFRRSVPYGIVTDHGLHFIGFSKEQRRLQRMLEQMVGLDGGPRDALTNFSTPLTGAYYFVPSVQALARFTTPSED